MILVVLAIGIILLVSALRGTYGTLFSALGQDVPHFVVWGAAIVALGAIGYIPGLKPISRGLLALVIIVLIFNNYAAILKGFQAVAKAPSSATGNTTNNGSGSMNMTATAVGTGAPTASGAATITYGYETPPSAYSSGM